MKLIRKVIIILRTQAIRIASEYPFIYSAFFNRGEIRFELKDYQGAITDYTQAILMKPDFATPYTKRGNVRTILGDKQGAAQDFQQAAFLAQDPNNKFKVTTGYAIMGGNFRCPK